MAKNMTRKGLALGAAASLVAAGFVGATPAYAAFATLDAAFGTSGATQNGLLGQTFNLAATSDTTGSAKFYVAGASASELTVTHQYVTSLSAIGAGSYSATTEVDQTSGNDKATTIAPASWTAGNYAQMNWSLTGVTSTRTITITPFLDTVVADGKITAGEVAGTPVSLTFHKASEVTATTTLGSVTVGATSIKASVVLDKGINMAAIGGGVSVYFAENGAAFGNVITASYVKADAAFTASTVTGPTAGRVYTAQARVGGTTSAENSGAAAISTVTTGTVATLSAPAASKSTYYLATSGSSSDVVRAGSGTIKVSTTAKDSSSNVVSGAPVTFKIEETAANSIDAAATITAGGKTLSGTSTDAQSISVTVNAGTDGVAALEIAYVGIKEANDFKVTISAVGTSGAAQPESDLYRTFTGQDSVAKAIVDVNKLGGASGDDPVHTTTVGGAIAVAYKVVDQFGQTPEGTHRLKVATAATGGTINSTIAVTAGAANLAIADNSDASGSYLSTATVERYSSTSDSWSVVSGVNETSTIKIGSLPAATRVTVTETPDSTSSANQNTLSSAALATVDARLSRSSVTLPTLNSNSILSGVVYGANGAPQAGATVTISSEKVMFVTNAGTAASAHYSLGSTTIKTDANGAWGDVQVLSTTAGKHVVTIASGSGTTTTDVYFGAAAGNAGSAVAITAPSAVVPGSTLQISAVVTDKFGNPVNTNPTAGSTADVSISYSGPGLIVGTLPTETDSSGKLNFNVLMGSNDSGTFSVTVTYRSTGSSTATADLKSATASVAVGTSATNQGVLATWTKNLGDGSAKMYAKNVLGEGKIQFKLNGKEIAWTNATTVEDYEGGALRVVGSSNYLVRTVKLASGKNVLEIIVDGYRMKRVVYSK